MPISRGYVIDFKYMLQIKVQNPQKQRKVHRGLTNEKRMRPGTNFRCNDSTLIMLKSKSMEFTEENFYWLGKRWADNI